MSKRLLTELVAEGLVSAWDDPRMPTIAGLRRRGYTPASIREFCKRIGVTKMDNSVEMGMLEACIREELDTSAPRRMAVLHPLKVTIDNYPDGQVEKLNSPNHPKDEAMGKREIPFTQDVYIDQNDFLEVAPNKKFKRLVAGGEVRLRNSYVIRCNEVIKDENGNIIELKCSYDAATLGKSPEGRKVKGVIHWVSAKHAVPAEIRLYDRLMLDSVPSSEDWKSRINPESLVALEKAVVEPSLADAEIGQRFQFEREGYFCRDTESNRGRPVFNRVVTLRDSWAKIENKGN
jgi:glutaminyl-tRNA synthetase